MGSTKDAILHLLKTNHQLTVSQMVSSLNITEMAVRRHLQSLERDQLIEATLVRQTMGRPLSVYSLTKQGQERFPRNYASFTVDLLQDLEDLNGIEVVHLLFERRKERLLEKYRETVKGEQSFEEKLNQLVSIQNNLGYMVNWDKDGEGNYVFQEHNCPISDIATKYPVACKYELELFKELLGTESIQCSKCMAIDEEPHCTYKIKSS